MAQGDGEILLRALELEEAARAYCAQGRQTATDPFLAATLHFLETQHALAIHQLEDERLRLQPPTAEETP